MMPHHAGNRDVTYELSLYGDCPSWRAASLTPFQGYRARAVQCDVPSNRSWLFLRAREMQVGRPIKAK